MKLSLGIAFSLSGVIRLCAIWRLRELDSLFLLTEPERTVCSPRSAAARMFQLRQSRTTLWYSSLGFLTSYFYRTSGRMREIKNEEWTPMGYKNCLITEEQITRYTAYLQEQERSDKTVYKYKHSLMELTDYLGEQPISKVKVIEWKKMLCKTYAPATVNLMLTAINCFFQFMGWGEFKIRLLRIQRSLFRSENRELTQTEYTRLVRAAQQEGNERLSLILQTICSTGIRVSELKYVTVEAVHTGRAEVCNKGKRRTVFLPDRLCRVLKKYIQKQKNTAEAVFVTRSGKPMDRSNIWREMKSLCKRAGVKPEKVFPHNLRHLFARTFYTLEKDLSRLADILGHSSVSTTRIYTAESGKIHQKQMERMGLVITT